MTCDYPVIDSITDREQDAQAFRGTFSLALLLFLCQLLHDPSEPKGYLQKKSSVNHRENKPCQEACRRVEMLRLFPSERRSLRKHQWREASGHGTIDHGAVTPRCLYSASTPPSMDGWMDGEMGGWMAVLWCQAASSQPPHLTLQTPAIVTGPSGTWFITCIWRLVPLTCLAFWSCSTPHWAHDVLFSSTNPFQLQSAGLFHTAASGFASAGGSVWLCWKLVTGKAKYNRGLDFKTHKSSSAERKAREHVLAPGLWSMAVKCVACFLGSHRSRSSLCEV